jgi:hypothetical protein
MNKTTSRLFVGLLLIGIGIAGGFLLGRQSPEDSKTIDEIRMRFRSGDDLVFASPPLRTEWDYPKSRSEGAIDRSGYKDDFFEYSIAERAVMTTPDDFDTVCDFYKKKLELRPPQDNSVLMKFEASSKGNDYLLTLTESKHANWFEGAKESETRSLGFQVTTLRYHLAGFISRGKGDSKTQIVLFYRPQSEFISVAKRLQMK